MSTVKCQMTNCFFYSFVNSLDFHFVCACIGFNEMSYGLDLASRHEEIRQKFCFEIQK